MSEYEDLETEDDDYCSCIYLGCPSRPCPCPDCNDGYDDIEGEQEE